MSVTAMVRRRTPGFLKIVGVNLFVIALSTVLLTLVDTGKPLKLGSIWDPQLVFTGLKLVGIVSVTYGLVWYAVNSTLWKAKRRTGSYSQSFLEMLPRLRSLSLAVKLIAVNVILIVLVTFLGLWLLNPTFSDGITWKTLLGLGSIRLIIVFAGNYFLLWIVLQPLIRLRAATELLRRGESNVQAVRSILSDPDVDQFVDSITKGLTQVGEYRQKVLELSARTAQQLEAERQKIARELHDNIGQNLAALLVLQRLSARSSSDEEREKNLEQIQALTRVTLEEVHRLSLKLRPAILDQTGLPSALEWYVKEVVASGLPEVDLQLDKAVGRFAPEAELALYRIAQEALGNAARHAKADLVTVQLTNVLGWVELRVTDNGMGFNPDEAGNGDQKRLGLFTMLERAHLIGGEFEVNSAPGMGTTVVARVLVPTESGP